MPRRITAVSFAAVMLAGCGSPQQGTSQSAKPEKALTPVERGQRAFRECAVCHIAAKPGTPEGDQKLIGPNLFGVVGRKAGSLPDFSYSKALRESTIIWDATTLDAYIKQPTKEIPGNRMSFAGEPDAAKRADIIAFLESLT